MKLKTISTAIFAFVFFITFSVNGQTASTATSQKSNCKKEMKGKKCGEQKMKNCASMEKSDSISNKQMSCCKKSECKKTDCKKECSKKD